MNLYWSEIYKERWIKQIYKDNKSDIWLLGIHVRLFGQIYINVLYIAMNILDLA
jgi:hypothetical protein